jgi:hypothetical protein
MYSLRSGIVVPFRLLRPFRTQRHRIDHPGQDLSSITVAWLRGRSRTGH